MSKFVLGAIAGALLTLLVEAGVAAVDRGISGTHSHDNIVTRINTHTDAQIDGLKDYIDSKF